jgi:hypothetical protein
MKKLSLRHFDGFFLVTDPDTGTGQVQDAPASTDLVRRALSRFADQRRSPQTTG